MESAPSTASPPVPRPTLRRPLCGLAIAFAAGVVGGLHRAVPVPVALAAVVLLLASAILLARRAAGRVALYTAVLLLGWARAALVAWTPSALAPAAALDRSREHVELRGVVRGDPVSRLARDGATRIWTFPLAVDGIRRSGPWQMSRGTVSCTARSGAGFEYGQRWRLAGVLTRPDPGLADRSDVLVPSFDADRDAARLLSEGHGWSWLRACFAARRACASILERGVEDLPDSSGMVKALLLGYRQDLGDRLYRVFSATGTFHIIAISGMHVAVIVSILVGFLRMAGRGQPYWIFYLAPALIVYALATGASPSAVRAVVMALVFWTGSLLRRKPDGPAALAFSAIVILGVDPAQVLDLGFLFSFAAVTGLFVLYPPIMRRLGAGAGPEPWAIEESKWAKRRRAAWLFMMSVCAASCAAWIATAPLTAHYFNLVSPAALPGNLVVVPLSSAVLLTGILSLLTGWMAPWVSEVFNHANHVFVQIILWWVEWIDRLPAAHFYVRSPPPAVVIALYAGILALVVARGATRRLVAGVWGLAVVLACGSAWLDRDAFVDVLDAGEGNAALVNVPGPADLLVDAGQKRQGQERVRQLRQRGVDRLAAVVVSHGDADHIGAASAVLDNFRVDELWCCPFAGRSPSCRALLADAARRGIRIRRLCAGDAGVLGGGVTWQVLSPAAERQPRDSDEGSLVMRVARAGDSVLFMGDAGRETEAILASRPVEASARVLVAGRHGSADATGEDWLGRVAPEVVVLSTGAENREGHPDARTIERIRRAGATVWRTDEDGGVRIALGDFGRPVPALSLTPLR